MDKYEPVYYDRDGKAITLSEYIALREDGEYYRVAADVMSDGAFVSTVWLGLDHGWGSGDPLIFETMIFPTQDIYEEQDCWRYSTEAEARQGHIQAVRWLKGERRTRP